MHGMGGMMDVAYACRAKRGSWPCRAVACMPPSGRVSERGTHSNSISPQTARNQYGKKKCLLVHGLAAVGGARMHASTTDLCVSSFWCMFSGAPSHRSPLCVFFILLLSRLQCPRSNPA
jgi:hypothetical protein